MVDNIYLLIFYGVIAVFVLVFFFLILYIRNQNMLWQQRKLFQETEIFQQKQLLNAVIESQEIERKRIGEDLHDEIGGTLSAIKLMLNALKIQAVESQEIIIPAKQLIDKMIGDVRNIAHDLSPPGLAMFGLYTTIEAFVSLINKSGEVDILITQHQELDRTTISEKAELALFRVVTQLIANTLKHAEATKIALDFNQSEHHVEINYQDNGKGFDQAVLQQKKGIGMQNIQSRLQMIDATYTLQTSPNKGFKMEISVPIQQVVK